MVKLRISGMFWIFCGAAVAGAAVAADTRTFEPLDPGNRYTRIPAEALELIAAGERAFAEQDADASGAYLAEDYSWYHVTAEGPKRIISGRDKTVELLESFFNDDSWRESEVHRLGMLDNILVQVEIDRIVTEDGPETRRSITVYEFKDGMRWREWKFYPAENSGR